MATDEFFGNDDQRAVLRRGRMMVALLDQDERYFYYGRTLGLTKPEDGDVDQLAALAIVQGNAAYGAVRVNGAHALLEMETRFGFGDFMTGVEPGNAPSESVCTRMGLSRGDVAIMGCADPHALAGGRMTK
ncbi:hypothetical protein MUY35_02200 [Aliiroseovarius sp. S1339]|uniref:hypothetical protein n=1 Tax=Aliiroseovarius sp. S1339 TaxID=2936990 RepID=UPI0020BFA29B|nr:hypothetical protein [Aliiroseovarius sp. S1339]MCK8462658.1 hypothetical protein [Aliiroseovarius sp. S1339]